MFRKSVVAVGRVSRNQLGVYNMHLSDIAGATESSSSGGKKKKSGEAKNDLVANLQKFFESAEEAKRYQNNKGNLVFLNIDTA